MEIDMQIQLSFKRMFRAPGKTFAVPTAAGARVRVVDGMVWATTSSNPDDFWLGAGDEHTVRSPGLTVIDSVSPSTVELVPPAEDSTGGHLMNRYEMKIPRLACNIVALAMSALTLALLVVLPATTGPQSHEAKAPGPSIVAAAPEPNGSTSPPQATR